jgi:hypothetical protein
MKGAELPEIVHRPLELRKAFKIGECELAAVVVP